MAPDGPSITDTLLRSFPAPVVVRPRRFHLATCLIYALCFLPAGAFLLARDGNSAMPWGSTAFIAIGALVLGFCLLPGSVSLALDRTGFRFTFFYVARRAEWRTCRTSAPRQRRRLPITDMSDTRRRG